MIRSVRLIANINNLFKHLSDRKKNSFNKYYDGVFSFPFLFFSIILLTEMSDIDSRDPWPILDAISLRMSDVFVSMGTQNNGINIFITLKIQQI